jgi:Spy/CpxP family protein refolding chaperone
MKKLILLSALLIAGITVNAQGEARQPSQQQTQGAADKATKQTQVINDAVVLTDAQKEKVYAINFEKNKAMDAAAMNKSTFEAEKSRLKSEREKEIMAVLTPEQQTKFKQAKAEKAQKEKAAQK